MQRTDYLSPARDASILGPAPLAAYPRRRFPAPPRTAGTACPMTEGGTERRSLAATIARCGWRGTARSARRPSRCCGGDLLP